MIEQYLKGLKVPKDELTAIERNKLLNEGKDVDRIMCCIDFRGDIGSPDWLYSSGILLFCRENV